MIVIHSLLISTLTGTPVPVKISSIVFIWVKNWWSNLKRTRSATELHQKTPLSFSPIPRSIWNHATLWTEVACKSHRNLILALCSMREDVAENSRAQQSTIVANDKPIQKWHRHNQHTAPPPWKSSDITVLHTLTSLIELRYSLISDALTTNTT